MSNSLEIPQKEILAEFTTKIKGELIFPQNPEYENT